ncbi:hypothetical protein G3N56_12360 [Desulfovibrio sulfodismutans]|uniref:DUF1640 domain-containing protein n=1 Tax=Desulfolutivibrio sulfodismutans TaxID=63561 RepID=A0A7K3NMV1_9BACT|nr:hypothetical protein [Desulfolutivibrio sulfodismutans]NDY57526.1 hypothetical protein [Desulfolutivibrio sulfodismutans]QLA14343.1 hypothetical protein GD606_19775 [Desulfolutivibrio sulfodismutans DSM 3696]
MTLLFDDTKKLEKALGEEAASVLIGILEKQGEEAKRELATKADIDVKLAQVKAEIIKWVAGLMLAQTAIIAALKLFG